MSKEIELSKESVEEDILKGLTTEQIADKYKVSKRTIFRRKVKWGISQDPHKQKTIEQYKLSIADKPIEVLSSTYSNNKNKLRHKCKLCDNIWEVTPNDIIGGHGCPVCASSTFYRYLYIIRLSNGLFKVGVTNNPNGRQGLGLEYEILSWVEAREDVSAHIFEAQLLKLILPYKVNSNELQDGNTETYYIEDSC